MSDELRVTSDESPETVEAIMAEIREHIAAAREYPHDIEITTCDVEDWADRIKAAYGREVAELRKKAEAAEMFAHLCQEGAKHSEERLRDFQKGNAAKLRMAVCDLMGEYVHRKCPPEKNCEGCERKCGINDAWLAVSAALSATGRNCDKYRTAEEAKDAWENQSGARDYDTFAWWCFATEEDMAPAEGGAE